jgi:ATP-dependent exoDNAse (exonuclease V) alpha subunit
VQTLDGRWLSIDGRVLFKANVAASETYNTALEQHLHEALGVRFAERPGTDPAKRPIREVVGVDPRLNQRCALTLAWTEDGGQVIGLIPSAAAAAVLGEQTGIRTDTLTKLTWSLQHGDLPDWAAAVGPSTLVIIDEAGMADTLTLDAAVRFAIDRGASVRLIGDDQQLAAIGAGGVLRDITQTHGALHLTELHRFTNPVEAAASLGLREGKPEALDFYLDHDRIHVGDIATTTEDAFTAWVSDRAAGLDAIMLAPSRQLVTELNRRARAHRLDHSPAGSEVALADGNQASVGDVIITRSNDRRLRLSATDWVKTATGGPSPVSAGAVT